MDKKRSAGIVVEGGSGNGVVGNTVIGFDEGIRLSNTRDGVVSDNLVTSLTAAVEAMNGRVAQEDVQATVATVREAGAAFDEVKAREVIERSRIWGALREVGPDVMAFVIKTIMKLAE
jgi:parallel beta-helix repeat protein